MTDKKTPVGENINAENANWTFSGDTCKGFDNHVKKSVPFYEEGHDLICHLSDFFIKQNSHVYEIGTSTGQLINKIANRNQNKEGVDYTGIDNQKEMIDFANANMKKETKVNFVTADALAYPFEKSDLIISYYTIQFIPPRIRQDLINHIYNSLNWGGAFVLFEKVRANDARFQDIMTELYTEFKLEKGYSPEEIINKTRSLKGVLEPFSTQGNLDLLKRAGFVDMVTVMKYTCFEGTLCIK